MRENFIFYANYALAASTLGDKARLKLYDAIVKLGLTCVENVTELERLCSEIESNLEQNRNVFAQFLLIKKQILTSLKNQINGAKGKEYGRLGGAPDGNKNAVKKQPPKQPQNNPRGLNKNNPPPLFKKEKEQEKERTKEKEEENIKNYIPPYIPPTIEEKTVEEVPLFVGPTFDEVISRWEAYKRQRRQTYTPMGREAMIKNLRILSGGNPDLAMRIVNQSIANNWSGLFPLKDSRLQPLFKPPPQPQNELTVQERIAKLPELPSAKEETIDEMIARFDKQREERRLHGERTGTNCH